jgi:DNA modification methylase
LVRAQPGRVRDAILTVLEQSATPLTPSQIHHKIEVRFGFPVAASSVRSYLNLHAQTEFRRVGQGAYVLDSGPVGDVVRPRDGQYGSAPTKIGQAEIYLTDCIEWLSAAPVNSVHAVVTDPPYGPDEYSYSEQLKLRSGRGGNWRIPPSLDGARRSPLPRFTTVDAVGRASLREQFHELGQALLPVLVPGAHIFLASNPLFSHLIGEALSEAGLERRGEVVRLVQTLRGGDRPKNAHEEFPGVTVMPRSMWEPWLLFRKPLEDTVAETLRKWGTGGLRRVSDARPFGDVILSSPTRSTERQIAPHPSLKPQAFLRQIVRASLPLGQGVVLDPFAGSGSTLAAANNVGYRSIGLERDLAYFDLAKGAVPRLASLETH